jgi:Protein of unknown function (DUF2796)
MVVWFLLVLASLFPSVTTAEQAHEHGVATLDVAVDGRTLTLQFESPLDNVVGFEHAPRTDKQRAALKKMEETLQAAERLFKPAPAAACTLRGVTVDHPYRTPAATGQVPPAGSKGRAQDAQDKAAKVEEEHTEVSATYELDCAKPEALDRVEVLIFEAFPGVKRLRAQTASPRGQRSATLTARSRALPF